MTKPRFVYPLDGDMLTGAAGRLEEDETLWVDVAVQAQEQAYICGKQAQKGENGLWTARIPISMQTGAVVLSVQAGNEQQSIVVYPLPCAAGKYALSVDDNIWWLAELNRDRPKSIFDHPYLQIFRHVHEEYGAKVRFNLFYQVEEKAVRKYGPFNLSMMTDQYRDEFRANADWLHLAFHSLQEEPGDPYITASYEAVYGDCSAVHKEIIRFAGEETLERATTIHFGVCSPEGVQALQDLGIKTLMGCMTLDSNGRPVVSYHLSREKVLEMQRFGLWRDPESGMKYGKIAAVMNLHSPERIAEILTEEHKKNPLRGFIEIMIHEQYFYDDYHAYEPDFAQRVFAGCRWCCERGWIGAFTGDVV